MKFQAPKLLIALCMTAASSIAFAGVTFTAPAKPPVTPAKAPAAAAVPAKAPTAVVAPVVPPVVVAEPAKAKAVEPTKTKPVDAGKTKPVVAQDDSVDGTPSKPKASSPGRKQAAKSAPVVVSQASLDYLSEITAALAAGSKK